MNRKEVLRLLLNQAQFNGFEFRPWYLAHIHPVWPSAEQALTELAGEGRFYTLLFSHEFAQSFWRAGSKISFSVPGTTYSRVNSHGDVLEVTRKSFTRRTNKPNVWKYHLCQMAATEDPLDYICRFLPAPDQGRLRGDDSEPLIAQA